MKLFLLLNRELILRVSSGTGGGFSGPFVFPRSFSFVAGSDGVAVMVLRRFAAVFALPAAVLAVSSSSADLTGVDVVFLVSVDELSR